MAENCQFNVMPLVQSKIVKNNIFTLNHTGQDYWSMKSRMMDLIKQNYAKDFNDFTESSLGMMLLEMYAFLADQLSFKIDQISNEVFIDTVTELYNANRLANFVGFKPTPPLPSKALFSAAINSPISIDLPIQAPIIMGFMAPGVGEKTMELFAADGSNNPIFGKPIIIPAGSMATTSIVGLEGRTYHTSSKGAGVPWQKIEVGIKNVLYRSVRLSVNDEIWEEVEYFTNSKPKKEFRVEYTSDYKAIIIFGNNKLGLIPTKESNIKISYRVGGGELGNIVTGSLERSIPLSLPGMNQLVTVHFKNFTKGEGGYDGDTIEDIRKKLPVYLKMQNRAVSDSDYKYLVDNFATATNGSIGKSTLSLRNYGCSGNIIDIYVLARQGEDLIPANKNLKLELMNEINKKKMFTDYVCIRDGDITIVDIHLEATLDKFQKKFESSIRNKINTRVQDFFSLHNWEFGQMLKESDIIKILADVEEIEHLDISFTTTQSLEKGFGHIQNITVSYNEIIRPDNINLEFNYK